MGGLDASERLPGVPRRETSECHNHPLSPLRTSPSMAYDKNVSPVGWYVASYLLRFVEVEDEDNGDLEKRFLSWENTVLVQAKSLDHAFDKVVKIARGATKPYRGGPAGGVPVKWEFEGITSLLPIYEEIADGVEIAWEEHPSRKLKTLRGWVSPKADFHQ